MAVPRGFLIEKLNNYNILEYFNYISRYYYTDELIINTIDYFIYNRYKQQMEYWSASDSDAIIWKKQIVSKQEFLNRNLEKFILK